MEMNVWANELHWKRIIIRTNFFIWKVSEVAFVQELNFIVAAFVKIAKNRCWSYKFNKTFYD